MTRSKVTIALFGSNANRTIQCPKCRMGVHRTKHLGWGYRGTLMVERFGCSCGTEFRVYARSKLDAKHRDVIKWQRMVKAMHQTMDDLEKLNPRPVS